MRKVRIAGSCVYRRPHVRHTSVSFIKFKRSILGGTVMYQTNLRYRRRAQSHSVIHESVRVEIAKAILTKYLQCQSTL